MVVPSSRPGDDNLGGQLHRRLQQLRILQRSVWRLRYRGTL